MSLIDGLFDQIKKAITEHGGENSSNLLTHVTDLFDKHKNEGATGGAAGKDVKPASQDPYGDPADQGGKTAQNVKPASQDPYGDPADQKA